MLKIIGWERKMEIIKPKTKINIHTNKVRNFPCIKLEFIDCKREEKKTRTL